MPKLPSIATFALAIACFFLPFVTVSCAVPNELSSSPSVNVNTSATITGIQLATGQMPPSARLPEINRPNQPTDTGKPEIFAIIPLIPGVVGLGTNFLNPVNLLIPAIAGGSGAVSLLLLKNRIDSELTPLVAISDGLLQVKYEYGFWLALLLFISASALNLYDLFYQPRRR